MGYNLFALQHRSAFARRLLGSECKHSDLGRTPSRRGARNCVPTDTFPVKFSSSILLQVDHPPWSVHFWDPMTNRLALTALRAPTGAEMPRAGAMFMITAIMTTTWKRGASG